MNRFDVIGIVGFVVFTVVAAVVLHNSFEIRAQKQAEAAYQQGFKDALYKRPASDELERVCAGLWLSQLKPGKHEHRSNEDGVGGYGVSNQSK